VLIFVYRFKSVQYGVTADKWRAGWWTKGCRKSTRKECVLNECGDFAEDEHGVTMENSGTDKRTSSMLFNGGAADTQGC
jgi:hypothetical protein